MWRLLFCLVVTAVHALGDDTVLVEPTGCDDDVEMMLQNGNAAFTGSFLYNALQLDPEESSMISAYSVLKPLGQLALYARGDTLTQILNVLNVPDKSHIRCGFPRLINKLRAENDVILNTASKIFASDKHPLSENFLTDTKEVFDAEAENIDFLDRQGATAAERINEWVEEETNDRIKDLATPDMFDEDTRLALVNALYFKANWTNQFKPHLTMDRPFHTETKTVDVPTMFQEDYFKYGEDNDLDCRVLEMFYRGNNFSFVIFLPNTINGLVAMVDKLQDPAVFYNAYENTRTENVQVYLPKINIESEYDLQPILESVGIEDIFDRRRSKLGGITKDDVPLYISAAKQKTFLDVTEEGTEAAAANIFVGAEITSIVIRPPPYIFEADRPFAFYIMHRNNILFCGYYT